MSDNPKLIRALKEGKAPFEYLVLDVLEEDARVHAGGGEKYGMNNWRLDNIKASTYKAAILRHFIAWFGGEDIDRESGYSHLAHIRACCAILRDSQMRGTLIDDRHFCESKDQESGETRSAHIGQGESGAYPSMSDETVFDGITNQDAFDIQEETRRKRGFSEWLGMALVDGKAALGKIKAEEEAAKTRCISPTIGTDYPLAEASYTTELIDAAESRKRAIDCGMTSPGWYVEFRDETPGFSGLCTIGVIVGPFKDRSEAETYKSENPNNIAGIRVIFKI